MLLTLSNLFPRPDEPDRGLFNAQCFDALAARLPAGEALRNLCLVPCWQVWRRAAIRDWVSPRAARYATRYVPVFYLPLAGRNLNWRFYCRGLREAAAEAARCDGLLGTWLYPDAVAAARLAAAAGKPLWLKVHGGDVLHLNSRWRRNPILRACRQAEGIFCVSRPLAEELARAGVDPRKLHVVPNGVNTERFRPRDRAAARARLLEHLPAGLQPLGPATRLVLYVGHLVPVKGPDRLLEAWAQLQQRLPATPLAASDGCRLVIVGEGRLRRGLERTVRQQGLGTSVAFLDAMPHDQIAQWMNAADCLCLPSRREGMPNVVLEALASGLPVVAADVGEVRQLLGAGEHGRIVDQAPIGFAGRLATALAEVLSCPWPPERLAAAIRPYTWESAARAMLRVMRPEAAAADALSSQPKRQLAATTDGGERQKSP